MTPIELLRELFGYGKEVSDHQVVALVYEEFTQLRADKNAQDQLLAFFGPQTIEIPKSGISDFDRIGPGTLPKFPESWIFNNKKGK